MRAANIETELSFKDINFDVDCLAAKLQALGVKKGDRVVLYLEKSLIFIIAHIALQSIGAISVPLNPGFKKAEMLYLLNDADPKLILAGISQERTVKEIDPNLQVLTVDTDMPYQYLKLFDRPSETPRHVEIKANDPALIIYTSGTTGRPKGAVLTHKNLADDALKIMRNWK